MIQEISQFFNRFYQITIKQHINDPIIHSQWLYFLSMFKSDNLQKQRIQLYLGILSNEKKKKNQLKQREHNIIYHNNHQNNHSNSNNGRYRGQSNKTKLINSGQNQISLQEIKLEKRLSQNLQPFKQYKNETQSIGRKKIHVPTFQQSMTYHRKSSEQESKSLRSNKNINQNLYAMPTTKVPNCMTYLKAKCANDIYSQIRQNKHKQKYAKLKEISRKLVSVFQSNNKLRS